jgi:lysophospholipase L1-like esterase
MRRLLAWLLGSVFSSFPLFAQPTPVLRAEEGLHIVIIGSSTAAGVGPSHPSQAWVNRLREALKQRIPHSRITNLAAPGYQTYQLLPSDHPPVPQRPRPDRQRNISMAISLAPDLIIVNAPSNDAAAGYGFAEQKQNFLTITRQAQRAGIPVWVSTTQPRMLSPQQVTTQEQLRDWITATYQPATLDFWHGLADCAGWLKAEYDSGDGTHLNAAGHDILFQRARQKAEELILP